MNYHDATKATASDDDEASNLNTDMKLIPDHRNKFSRLMMPLALSRGILLRSRSERVNCVRTGIISSFVSM